VKIFHFSLAPLLDVRKNQERDRARNLAQARQESESARRAKEDLLEIHRAGRSRLAEAHRSGGPVGVLKNMELLLERMGDRVQAADQVVKEADLALTESVRDYTEAVRERTSLDRLRERRMEEWRVEEGRKEQKEIDEIALTRHGRRVMDPPREGNTP